MSVPRAPALLRPFLISCLALATALGCVPGPERQGLEMRGGVRPSLLLISIDTLRADRLSLHGYGRETSPGLDAFAREEGITFLHTVAAAPWTLPSHVSMLSGLEALRHGINHNGNAGVGRAAEHPFLAEILGREGYATAAFTGGGYLHPNFGLGRGFDLYRYWEDRGSPEGELAANISQLRAWIDQQLTPSGEDQAQRPFFAFLHTYAVHDPWRARQPHLTRLYPGLTAPSGALRLRAVKEEPRLAPRRHRLELEEGEEHQTLPTEPETWALASALYDSAVAEMDAQLAPLLVALRPLVREGKLAIAITSDHGEALGEGGRLGHFDLHDPTLQVPLLLALPGSHGAGRRIREQVRSVDLLPTLLEALGLEPPADIDGLSLLPLIEGRSGAVPAFAWSYSGAGNHGLALRVRGRLKLIYQTSAWLPSASRLHAFDLDHDPREERALDPADPRLGPLLTSLRRTWNATGRSLRLRLANPGEGGLRGRILGPSVLPTTVKSIDPQASSLLAFDRQGKASFALPPGTAIELAFEEARGHFLRLEIEATRDRGAGEAAFELNTLDGPRSLIFGRQGWHQQDRPLAPGEAGFQMHWQGGEALPASTPTAGNPELLRQLEALGYL